MNAFLSTPSRALAIVVALAAGGAGCSSSPPSIDLSGGDAGALDGGGTSQVLQAAPGQIALRVNQAAVVKSRDTKSGLWSKTMAYLSVTIANGAGGADVPANVALFSVKTSTGISKLVANDAPFVVNDQSYSASAFVSDPACDPSLSISGRASLTCTIAATFDGDVVPVEVTYRTPGALAEANGVATPTSDKRSATTPFQAAACAPCGDLCTDLSADSYNCGACGVPAPTSGACVHGLPVCDDARDPNLCTRADHTAYCTNFQTSAQDCGACGTTLPSSSTIGCVAGRATCTLPSDQLCTTKTGTPFCAALDTDSQNCGACGHVVSPSCLHGKVACNSSETDVCTGATGITFCTSLQDDYQNCGTCGRVCTSGSSCISGSCML